MFNACVIAMWSTNTLILLMLIEREGSVTSSLRARLRLPAYYSMIALLICALTVIALSADDCRYLRRDRAILHAPTMSHAIYISQRRYLDVTYTSLDTLPVNYRFTSLVPRSPNIDLRRLIIHFLLIFGYDFLWRQYFQKTYNSRLRMQRMKKI